MTPTAHRGRLVLAIFLLMAGCDGPAPETPPASIPAEAAAADPADYLGSEACRTCHADTFDAWQGSHHDLALQTASAESVLGQFPARLGEVAFERGAEGFRIRPEPEAADLPVLYTFGVTPLQQYVVPAGNGALQTFPVAWDSRSEAAGGQRWYALHDGDPGAGDPMHWTGRANRWNSQCADCHSTGVVKGYDAETATYHTTWAVEDVGCEACHGPGSRHAADPAGSGMATLATQADEIEVCAPCHSRRSQIAEGFRPGRSYLDYYLPQLIAPGLYHVDGQIDDEVYVYGSFLQSRMHLAGVTCSSCHDPHSATLRRPGNETCTFCHQDAPGNEFAGLAAGSYDTADHHFHPPGSAGAQCVSCHMPSRTYMGVDDRRDHSFRIPRPDLAVSLGVPDPCTGCHQDRSAAWAADVIREQFGETRPAHFAPTFAAADAGLPGADVALAALVRDTDEPIMIRASALARLGAYQRGYTLDAIRETRDGEPLLRLAASQAAATLTPESRWRLLPPLLDDPLRAVRHQAVTALTPTLGADPAYRSRLAPYLDVWIEEQSLNRDFPEVLTNLASAYLALGQPARAEAALSEALRLQPSWIPGLTNLADLYRFTGRDAAAGELLERALAEAPEEADVHYAYGLWLARQDRTAESLSRLEAAAMLAPNRPQFAYTWAVALNDAGDGVRAVAVLERLLERWPDDEQLLIATVTMLRDQGRFAAALGYLDRLIGLRPADAELIRFRETLAAAAGVS